jgi:hypothetical protein
MFAKLISLLIHAKAGAISGIFLLGATGALVSVSASNGVTTITLTDPSPSPSASASPSPSASPTATATPSASPTASASPSSSPSANPCADQAKALAFQVQRVDSAFVAFHTDLMKLRDQRDRATIQTADQTLKLVRQSAVKAIHAQLTCKKHDEDQDEDESHETGASTTSLNSDKDNEEDHDSDHAKTKPAPMTFTGDAASIGDQAIAAMQTAFDTAKNAPATTAKPAQTHKPEPTRSPKGSGKVEHKD